jgi:hypothetical protein
MGAARRMGAARGVARHGVASPEPGYGVSPKVMR